MDVAARVQTGVTNWRSSEQVLRLVKIAEADDPINVSAPRSQFFGADQFECRPAVS